MPAKSSFLRFALCCLAFGVVVESAAAATASASIAVSVTVQASCRAAIASTPMKTNTPAVSVACTNSAPYHVSLNRARVASNTSIPHIANRDATSTQSPASASDATAEIVIITY